jgi:arginine decarboxylase
VNLVAITPVVDRGRDIEHGTDPETLGRLLDLHPRDKAAHVISPTFFGVTSDIGALGEVCHARGVFLIVDAAWGAHYPSCDRLPDNPMAFGADVMVVSVHKTMGARAQGSFMPVAGDLIDRERFVWAFEMLQCTSPSISILASLDATPRAHVAEGQRIWRRVVDLADSVRERLASVDEISILDRQVLSGPGAHDLDPAFLILDVRRLGMLGYEADEWLQVERKVSAVLGDLRHGQGGDARFHAVPDEAPNYASLMPALPAAPALPPPRSAAAKFDRVPYEQAVGRIAGRSVAVVPPAIPRLLPGQMITAASVAFLRANLDAGAFILDSDEHGDGLIRVVREN